MFIFLIILAISQSSPSLDFILMYSQDTDLSLIQEIEKNLEIHSKIDLNQKDIKRLEEIMQKICNPFLLDLTENPNFFPILDEISLIFGTVYLTFTQVEKFNYSHYRFFLMNSYENEKRSINKMISFLSWSKFSIFFSANYDDIRLASYVKSDFQNEVDQFLSLSRQISDTALNTIVKKSIKASGTRKILFIGGSEEINRLQFFIQQRKLEQPGTHFLFASTGIYTAFLNGSLILTYPGTEESKDKNQFKSRILIDFLENFQRKNIIADLYSKCFQNVCAEEMKIYNIQNTKKVVVGTILNELNITGPIIYPGPTDSKYAFISSTPLKVSIANGTSEPYKNTTDYLYANLYKGAEYAVYRSNLLNDIPRFHIELSPTDCGNSYYDYSFSLNCFSNLKQSLGITYLTSLSSIGTLGNYRTLAAMHHDIPQLSPLSLIEDLNNKTKFPNLLKLGMSNYDYGESFLLFVLSYNWDSVIFFGSNESAYYLQYQEYVNIIESIDVKIINPENLRLFPDNMTRSDLNKYKDYFLFAKNSKCRIYLIATPFSALILEGLYDVGLRSEDVIIFSGISIINSMSEELEEKLLIKRQEFIDGINIFNYKEWIGDLGKQLYNEISSIVDYQPTYLCITYDSISVLKYSINHLLLLGEDYDSAQVLLKSMRLQKLTGCMGTIFFLSDSNAVATFQVGVGKLQFNQTSNKYYLSFYATSNKYDTQVIKYLKY